MKTIKTLLLLSCLLTEAVSVSAQTRWIAHKSHSGKSSAFTFDALNAAFGPGAGYDPHYEREQQKYIKMRIKTVDDGRWRYPTVALHLDELYMTFLNRADSLLGCNRNYAEYLTAGAIVHDQTSGSHFMYVPTAPSHFLNVDEHLVDWSTANRLYYNNSFIYTADYKKVVVNYPALDAWYLVQITQSLLNPNKETDPSEPPFHQLATVLGNDQAKETIPEVGSQVKAIEPKLKKVRKDRPKKIAPKKTQVKIVEPVEVEAELTGENTKKKRHLLLGIIALVALVALGLLLGNELVQQAETDGNPPRKK